MLLHLPDDALCHSHRVVLGIQVRLHQFLPHLAGGTDAARLPDQHRMRPEDVQLHRQLCLRALLRSLRSLLQQDHRPQWMMMMMIQRLRTNTGGDDGKHLDAVIKKESTLGFGCCGWASEVSNSHWGQAFNVVPICYISLHVYM